MWNESGVHYGLAGAFMNTSEGFKSPNDENKKTVRRVQNIIPATVKQLLNNPDEVFRIRGLEVHVVTIIGIVKSIDVTSTKVTYTVADDTGTINAILWLDGPMPDNGVVEKAYCRLHGSLRIHQGARSIMVFMIFPLKNLNELTTHLLEVVEFGLHVEQPAPRSPGSHTLSSSLMNVKMNERKHLMSIAASVMSLDASMMNEQELFVLDTIRKDTEAVGIRNDMIATHLGGKIPEEEIGEILAFLLREGHIYSAIDEDHFPFTT